MSDLHGYFGHVGANVEIHDLRCSIYLKPEMITVEEGARLDGLIKIEGGFGVHIGRGVHISSFVHLNIGGGKLTIGDYAAVTSGAAILSGTNTMRGRSMSSAAPASMQVVSRKETVICEYAFIGTRAIVYPGIRVGRFAVVKAGAVVTKDVPDFAIVAGVPAVQVGIRVEQEDGTFEAIYFPKSDGTPALDAIELVNELARTMVI